MEDVDQKLNKIRFDEQATKLDTNYITRGDTNIRTGGNPKGKQRRGFRVFTADHPSRTGTTFPNTKNEKNNRNDTFSLEKTGMHLTSKLKTQPIKISNNVGNSNREQDARNYRTTQKIGATQESFLRNIGVNEKHMPQSNINHENTIVERGADKLMDEHAAHILLIRKGKVIEETPEFISFKRVIDKDWNKITPFLKTLENFATILEYKIIKVDGNVLYKLSFKAKVSLTEILNAFVKPDDFFMTGFNVVSLMEELREKAALRIQTFIRMILAKQTVKKIKILIKKTKMIQNRVRIFLFQKECKWTIIQQNNARKKVFDALQEELKDNWNTIKNKRRLEIHYNNLPGEEIKKLSMSNYEQKLNQQIGRIYRVLDPNVDVVIVSAKELPIEV